MTRGEWLRVRVGDWLVDHMSGGARRRVLSVERYGRGPRTEVTLADLRHPSSRPVLICDVDDVRGARFSLE